MTTKFEKKKQPERKQIGVKIDSELWMQIKILALKQGRTGGQLLEDALRLYLGKYDDKRVDK